MEKNFILFIIAFYCLNFSATAQDKTPPSKDLQIITFESPDLIPKDTTFTIEKDSLEIIYNFTFRSHFIGLKAYTHHALMFTIQNHSNHPFFIDWEKSVKTLAGVNKAYSTQIYLDGIVGEASNRVHLLGTQAPVQETILPHSSVQGLFLENSDLQKNYTKGQKFDIESVGEYKTYVYKFEESNSPFHAQNFLVLSKTPNFSEPFYLSHRFYISKIALVPKSILRTDKNTYLKPRNLAVEVPQTGY